MANNRRRGPKRVRATIHVYPEVLQAYRHMSEVTGESLARTIGDWLWQTAETAGAMTRLYGEAKSVHGRNLKNVFERVAFYQAKVDELERDGRIPRTIGQAEHDQLTDRRPAPPAQPAGRPGATVSVLKPPRPVIRGDSVPNGGQRRGKT